MKQTAEGYINKSGIFRTMGLSDDPANPKYFDIAKEAKLQKTADDLKAARAGDSVFDAKFAKAFGDDYEAALSGPVTVMSGEGGSYSFGETSWGMGGGGRGRGRGPGGGDPDNPNLWGGSVGRFLYSAYIAKRLWSMTAAPAFADMEYYQKSAAEFGPASHYGQSESMDMTMGPGSSYARSQAVRAWSGEGVYSVAGGFGDLAYGLTDNKGLSRALAAGKIIGGLGAASYVLSSGIPAMLGMGSVAAAAPAIGGLAIGAGVGYLALEGYNAITGDDVTPVEVLRAVTTDIKERQYRYDPRRREEDWAKSPRFMSWAYPGDIDKLDVTAVRDTIEPIAISSGTTAENVLPLWYQMQNAAGQKLLLSPRKVTDTRASQGYGIANPVEGDVTVQEAQTSVPGVLDLFDKITAKASTMGMSGESLFNAGASIAEGEGFLPGTPDYMLKAAEYALLDEDERARQEGRTSRKRSAAASLAQYMRKGWRSALPFVQGLGEDFSEAELRAPMSVFDLASQAGANLEDLDSALYPTDDTGRRFTFRSQADVLFERSMDRGGIQTQRDVGVANALMERGFSSFGGAMYAAEAFGIDTPEKLSSSVGMLGAVSQYRELDQLGMLETLGAGARMTPYRASMAQSLLPQMARAGMSMPQMTSVVSGIGNMNDQDLYRLTREASGDLQYMSYQTYMDQNAYRGFGMEMPSLANRFYDQTGAPIFQSDFRSFMGMLSGQSALGNLGVGGTSGYWSSGTQAGVAAFNAGASPVEQAAAFFGSNDTQAMQAWAQNGAYGRTQLHAERMYGFQMAGIGLQLQGIALEQDFLWGGGTPTSPGQGSMWWFQDRQRSMQHKSTMADFSAQKESMERQNRFAEENAALSWERMGVTQSYQRDTFSMNWAQMRQQQEWTREDWQHQDTMRSLNYGWQQEDFDEALRTSTGRERKQILRQQDRAAITHNLEEGQIETQRGRQEELWKQEEDRFERQVDYSEKLMELDREGFEQSQSQREEAFAFEMSEFERRKREYLEQKKLQDQIIAAEREYKVAQMELQKQSAGIAAAAAAEQREYNQQIEQASDVFGRAAGYAHSIAENDPSYILRVLANFTDKLQNVSATNINNLGSMFTKLNYTTVGTNAQRIAGLVGSIDTVSLSKIQAIIRLLSELGGL